MEGGVFVYSFSIRGWYLGAAKINALREYSKNSPPQIRLNYDEKAITTTATAHGQNSRTNVAVVRIRAVVALPFL